MGRLDKAMRRAAEDQAAPSSTAGADLPLPSALSADELPSEAIDLPVMPEPVMAPEPAPQTSIASLTSLGRISLG